MYHKSAALLSVMLIEVCNFFFNLNLLLYDTVNANELDLIKTTCKNL